MTTQLNLNKFNLVANIPNRYDNGLMKLVPTVLNGVIKTDFTVLEYRGKEIAMVRYNPSTDVYTVIALLDSKEQMDKFFNEGVRISHIIDNMDIDEQEEQIVNRIDDILKLLGL